MRLNRRLSRRAVTAVAWWCALSFSIAFDACLIAVMVGAAHGEDPLRRLVFAIAAALVALVVLGALLAAAFAAHELVIGPFTKSRAGKGVGATTSQVAGRSRETRVVNGGGWRS